MSTLPGDIRYQIMVNDKVDDRLTSDLAEIEVNEAVRGETTFRIRFAIDICGTDMQLLNDSQFLPGADRKISVLASLGGVTTCLVHGLITERTTELKEGGPGSSLVITGKDRRIEMSRNADQRRPHNGTVASIVASILKDYPFTPDIEFGDTSLYSEGTGSKNQTSSDLELVTKLAGEQGYEFWIDSAVTGVGGVLRVVDTAHFKSSPPRGEGIPASVAVRLLAPKDRPVLQMNTGDGTSTLLTFASSRSSEVPTASGPITRIDIDTGGLDRASVDKPSLQPLGSTPPLPNHRRPLLTAGSAQDAQRRQNAALIDASWIVKATVETSAHALGALLRPHDIVSVRGTGSVDDGDYFVWSVSHRIDAADHKMRCELRRNAVGAS